MNRNEILETLKQRVPKTTPSTRNQYTLTLFKLARNLHFGAISDFGKADEIIKYLKKKVPSAQTRRVYLSALVAISGGQRYKDEIAVCSDEVKKKYQDQTPHNNQLDFKETKAHFDELLGDGEWADSPKSVFIILLFALFAGVVDGLPPRRLEDYRIMKFRDDGHGNYIDWDRHKFVFREFKTSKKYGTQAVDIPDEVYTILKIREKDVGDDSNYLLGRLYAKGSLSRKLTAEFGASVDVLRSSFLSYKYRDMPALREMEETAREMGHSVDAALNYYVK